MRYNDGMTYPEAVSYLEALVDFERLGFRRHFADTVNLDSISALLEALGNPQHGLPCVHIAGTKGKGSVAGMIESVLRAAGHHTGLFTSPHLVSFRERIRLGGEMVTEAQIAWAVEQVRGPIEQLRETKGLNPSTFFEAYTAMSYLLFRETGVQIAVMETGLGGRLDSTNTCEPVVCAITTLGLDHTEVLGDTLQQIAREKAGILKPGVPAVSAPQARAAEAVLREVAETVGVPLRSAPPTHRGDSAREVVVTLASGPLALELPLAGEHQVTNLSVAMGLVELLRGQGYAISDAAIVRGVGAVCLAGRLQVVSEKPWVVLDVAHNEPAAKALAATLPCMLNYDRVIAVLGLSAEKNAVAFCRELAPLVDLAILTRAQIERALPTEDLVRASEGMWKASMVAANVAEALEIARREAGEDDCILVTGSFYVVGEAMQLMGLG
ncbi:MAG: folylpolyglutamate synthase/dihydrofolate synthase family protein [Armatimonadota bacterium]